MGTPSEEMIAKEGHLKSHAMSLGMDADEQKKQDEMAAEAWDRRVYSYK